MLLPLQRLSLCSSQRGCEEKGFTLLELIVVTALIGIMLSISIPSLRSAFFTDPLKSSTRKVIGLVTGVRELANRSQQPYLLHINQLENRIWYEREVDGEENKENDTLQKKDLLLPESVKITSVLDGEGDGIGSSQDIVIWISKQGYLSDTIIRFEDDDGNYLSVQFYTFLDPAIVSDQATPF